jgi:predicted NACHT family NTPase
MVDWSSYLNSVCQAYAKWWQIYTFTDVIGHKKAELSLHNSLLNFDLMVQTVERDNERGQKQEKIERFSVLEGLRQYAPDHVLLVGRPGSGKSTALARLLLEEAQSALSRESVIASAAQRNVDAIAASRRVAISAVPVIPVLVEFRKKLFLF